MKHSLEKKKYRRLNWISLLIKTNIKIYRDIKGSKFNRLHIVLCITTNTLIHFLFNSSSKNTHIYVCNNYFNILPIQNAIFIV